MADEDEIMEYLEEMPTCRKQGRHRIRHLRDPFDFDDEEFRKQYRLTKDLARDLCEELRPLFRAPTRLSDISVETKVLTALSFYATGSYQRPTGAIAEHSMAQQTVSSVLAQVTLCLNTPEFRKKYIRFPANNMERAKMKTGFYNKYMIPGVIGCIDCSHVAIVRPVLNEERYYCRKHYHSLNVQLICDSDMNILSVDAGNGGASHDSFIWRNHPLKAHLENLSETENVWLLGDSGYPQRRYLMTPILNASPNTAEEYYTGLHVVARNCIERTIGLLKARFRCLLAHRVLHYTPEVAGSIVNACVILHNICNRANTPIPELSREDTLQESNLQMQQAQEAPTAESSRSNAELQQGLAIRNSLVLHLWEQRHHLPN